MNKKRLYILIIVLAFLAFFSISEKPPDTEIRIAVASNFSHTIKEIVDVYQQKSGAVVSVVLGSTGKFYAQISHGAPYDIFLAADKKRPQLLEKEGLAIPGSRFTYALGKLVLWSPQTGFVDSSGRVLQGDFNYISMANPKTAPYGKAAKEVLQKLRLWEDISGRIAYGEDVGQAFHFIQSGNAQLGFVAHAQLRYPKAKIKGSSWEIPQYLYSAIEQQAVLLKDKRAARDFLKYLQSKEAQKIITEYGYIIP